MTESEYYDPISDQENYEDDAIPKYNDSRDYKSEIDKVLFEWDELIISDSIKNDTNGYELIIQSFVISSKEIYISRMERKGGKEPWTNTSFNLGVNFEGGDNEKWYNLKKGELKK